MRYSTEPRCSKYVKDYGLSFAKKIGNKYGKKLMDTGTKLEWMQQKLHLKE